MPELIFFSEWFFKTVVNDAKTSIILFTNDPYIDRDNDYLK